MNALPISLVFFTSTKGHHGRKTDWRVTLDNWNKQVPLSLFNLIAHIKISPSDETLGTEMAAELRGRGFHVLTTVADWSRGLSHGANYLGDMVTVSKDARVYQRPFFLLLEDDSPILCRDLCLDKLLLQSCQLLEQNHERVTVRVMRRYDDRGPGPVDNKATNRWYWSDHVNFQPLLMRSLDYYRLSIQLEANPQACQQVQCEMLWRLVLAQFSRSPYKHLVWEPDVAETIHIGVAEPDHSKQLALLS